MINRRCPSRFCALAMLLLGCRESRPPPTDDDAAGLSLLTLSPSVVRLPADNRGGRLPPSEIDLVGWNESEGSSKRVWDRPLPVRPRGLFWDTKPAGMVVVDPKGQEMPHASEVRGAPMSWTTDGRTLTVVRLRSGDPPPLRLRDPWAADREKRLNLNFSGIGDPVQFARLTTEVDETAWAGIYVPAPGLVAFDLDVPPSAELSWTPVLVPPETRDLPAGDGVAVRVSVVYKGYTYVIQEFDVITEGAHPPTRADLSRWSGARVRLQFETFSRSNATQDYLLVAAPTVSPRRVQPRRIVLVFIDTLRADHTSLYGYSRDTTKHLRKLGESSTVFQEARSVAPWTLPSYRSAMTGRLPKYWAQSPTLAARFRHLGWATAMFAGNIYLSPRFDGNAGFDYQRLESWPSAETQTDRALAWLAGIDGQDGLVLVHYMDAHLPYQEPESFRSLFAGKAPRNWPERFGRSAVLDRAPNLAERAWIQGRYDNNIAYVDQQVGRLAAAISPHDLLVVFSDHGEEFWEHGGFEHGHATWEEVLRVPLLFHGPGFPAARVDQPVTLLDLAPTVEAWAKLPSIASDGRSQMRAAHGEALRPTPLPFGHALYGFERWGFVEGSKKYTATQGWEGLHDLEIDPLERSDRWQVAEAESWRAKLAEAHDALARPGWRIAVSSGRSAEPQGVRATLKVPGGVSASWAGEDAMGAGPVTVTVEDETVAVSWPPRWRGQREIYVVPKLPMSNVDPSLEVSVDGQAWWPVPLADPTRTNPDGDPRPLGSFVFADGTELTWTFGVAPEPRPADTRIEGYDPELEAQLRAAGYVVGPAAP